LWIIGVGSVWLSDVMDERLSRHDLTDEQWALPAPSMPPHPRGGTERQVGPLECTSARNAGSGTHGDGGAGKILKQI
jgi:hypothetical protein